MRCSVVDHIGSKNPTRAAQLVSPLVLALLVVAVAHTPIQAYLDPGAGSMLLQVVLGGAAAAGVLVRLFWRRLTAPFRRENRSHDMRES